MGHGDKPPARPASTPAPRLVQPCPGCPEMEIQINDTPATNDDLVLLRCEHPAHPVAEVVTDHRPTTRCRIRALRACAASSTVVLVNPDGRLRFPRDGDSTKTVSVPGDGSWASFEISGEVGSNVIGDAVIEAHCQTASGTIKARANVTVVWFDATIEITTPGTYSLTAPVNGAVDYTVAAGPAVKFSAHAEIKPFNVDRAAQQIKDLRVGIMHNVRAGSKRTITWGNPTLVSWAPLTFSGTTLSAPDTLVQAAKDPVDVNDSSTGADPLYDEGPDALAVPDGAQALFAAPDGRSTTATSNDKPRIRDVPLTKTHEVSDPVTGAPLATFTYTLVNIAIDDRFTTWAVIFNSVTKKACAIRERRWSLEVTSSTPGGQASAARSDGPPLRDPVSGRPFANENNALNRTPTPSGSKRFNKP